MVAFAVGLAAHGLLTFTFNFPYMERRRRIPDRRAVLEDCYHAVIAEVARAAGSRTLFIGGKSMGGRIATHVAAASPEAALGGLVLLGYPLHPPGRPADRRDAHLPDIRRPVLFVQGSRDPFGTPTELESALSTMSPAPALHVVEGGDHSFKISRGGRAGQDAVYREVQDAIVSWVVAVPRAGQ
jgi:predicted alpha/beta-hydrolase family hydrolase